MVSPRGDSVELRAPTGGLGARARSCEQQSAISSGSGPSQPLLLTPRALCCFPRRRRPIARCRSPTNSRKQRPTSPSVSARPSRRRRPPAANPPRAQPSSRPRHCCAADGDSLSEESKLLLYSLHQQATVVGSRRALAAAHPPLSSCRRRLAACAIATHGCRDLASAASALCGPPHDAAARPCRAPATSPSPGGGAW